MIPWTVCKHPTLRFVEWLVDRHHRGQFFQAHARSSLCYQLPHELHSLEQSHDGQCPDDLFISWPSKPSQGWEPSESRKGAWASISDLPQPCRVSFEPTPFSYVSSGIHVLGSWTLASGICLCISHGKRDWLLVEPIQTSRKEGTHDQTSPTRGDYKVQPLHMQHTETCPCCHGNPIMQGE